MIMTQVRQFEATLIDEADDPECYAKNLPPGGTDKWQLVEYQDGLRLWTPVLSYTFNTPHITDFTKVKLEVE